MDRQIRDHFRSLSVWDQMRRSITLFAALIFLMTLFLLNSFELLAQSEDDSSGQRVELSQDDPAVARVMKIQDGVTEELLRIDGIVGVGTGMTEHGQPAIVVFMLDRADPGLVPDQIEGIPTRCYFTDTPKPVSAELEGRTLTRSLGKTSTNRTDRWSRPVPIGVSTGNWNECSAGTIGVRVRNGDNYYVISCNHVFARTNGASLNEAILQPGRSEVNCAQNSADTIGTLADYQTIVHSTSANNTMDAALVRVLPWIVSNGTPNDGYGIPSSTVASASVNMSVKKYGKTTGSTTASVVAVNTTVTMNYAAGSTRFVNQIVTSNSGPFVDVGDSGSLVITNNSQKRPVGIVFGRSSSYAFVNPIGPILNRFNVVVDNSTNSPMPVELTSFSARLLDDRIRLTWTTATEINNFGFGIERLNGNETWVSAGFVPGAGNSSSPRDYTFEDNVSERSSVSTSVRYRLRQIDRDGTEELSPSIEVHLHERLPELNVYPHPVSTQANVLVTATDIGTATLHLYDPLGRRLESFSRKFGDGTGNRLVPLDLSILPEGLYFLEYSTPMRSHRQRIIVRR